MKQFIFCILLFLDIASNAMESPADVIMRHGMSPDKAKHELQSKFSESDLQEFRDEKYNNLLHIAFKALIAAKGNANDYPHLQNSYKPLVHYLINAGVPINDLNDDRKAPHFLVYEDDGVVLSNFAESLDVEFGAHPSYFSLQPEIRMGKKWAKEFLISCCPCFARRNRTEKID